MSGKDTIAAVSISQVIACSSLSFRWHEYALRFHPPVNIRKNVCVSVYLPVYLSVCSLYILTPFGRMRRNFPRMISRSRRRTMSTFLEKFEPFWCCRQIEKLTNRLAAFSTSKVVDREGDSKPSERSFSRYFTHSDLRYWRDVVNSTMKGDLWKTLSKLRAFRESELINSR